MRSKSMQQIPNMDHFNSKKKLILLFFQLENIMVLFYKVM